MSCATSKSCLLDQRKNKYLPHDLKKNCHKSNGMIIFVSTCPNCPQNNDGNEIEFNLTGVFSVVNFFLSLFLFSCVLFYLTTLSSASFVSMIVITCAKHFKVVRVSDRLVNFSILLLFYACISLLFLIVLAEAFFNFPQHLLRRQCQQNS